MKKWIQIPRTSRGKIRSYCGFPSDCRGFMRATSLTFCWKSTVFWSGIDVVQSYFLELQFSKLYAKMASSLLIKQDALNVLRGIVRELRFARPKVILIRFLFYLRCLIWLWIWAQNKSEGWSQRQRTIRPLSADAALSRCRADPPARRFPAPSRSRGSWRMVEPGGGGGGVHSQTEVVPMLVRAPQNCTLNGVIPGVKIYPKKWCSKM